MTRDQESSYDLSYIVMRMIALDVDRKEISLITALSEPAIRDIESRFKGTRLLNVPEVPLRDPFLFTCRDDLSKSDASFIDEVVRRRPHIFIPELLEELLEEHCIKSTADNVLIELRKRGLRRQQVYKFAKGRLEELRDQYDDIISSYTYDKLVFVGESQVETKNAFSPTVSSPQKPRQTRSTSRRSEPRPARSNAVSALGHEGVIHSEVFDHELRVAESTKFFKELVRRMSKSRRSVIALDPSFTRRDAKISDICNKAGIRIIHLPPYSPDYNPIEEALLVTKAKLSEDRKLKKMFQATKDNDGFTGIRERVLEAFRQISQKEAHEYFENTGYID